MKRKQRKRIFSMIMLFLLCGCMLIGLAGCAMFEDDEPVGLNANRGTNYDYDFVQYLDAHVYGSNGYGFLDIQPKDISISDFEDEKEYIAVKKVLDSLQLYIDPNNPQRTSYLIATKSTQLSNGDVVTLGISDQFDASTLAVSMNLEPYQFEIQDLDEPKEIDLFDNTSVDFVSLGATSDIYVVKMKGGAVPDKLLDVLDYSATTTDETLEPNKTILNVSLSLHIDEDEVDPQDADGISLSGLTLETYLGMKGYVAATTAEKVLREQAKSINFDTVNVSDLQNKLTAVLKANDEHFLSVANVQQSNSDATSTTNAFNYSVTYYSDNTSSNSQSPTACYSARMLLANTQYAGVQVLALTANGSKASDAACTSPFSDATIKVSYSSSDTSESDTTEKSTDEEKEAVSEGTLNTDNTDTEEEVEDPNAGNNEAGTEEEEAEEEFTQYE